MDIQCFYVCVDLFIGFIMVLPLAANFNL
jgi:hypothetical protein